MKILHIFKTEPNDEVKKLVEIMSEGEEAKTFELYKENVNYEELIDLVFECDKVISWW
ncbi:MAG: hypothetical protein LWW78_05900 [Deltaproteobacteria bacterium]|nr:hypothetical protein [Deltaproteobacteria bacterium]MDL1972758.1 hypothetical protein [Deltaproteobacteria bacterium]